MSKLELREIESRARHLAQKHGLECYLLTRFGMEQSLYAYVIQDSCGYHFIIPDEDGSVMERRTTQEIDDLLFWTISDAASRMALLNSLKSQKSGEQPFRQAWFDKELQILGDISPEWQNRRKREHDEVFRDNPEN